MRVVPVNVIDVDLHDAVVELRAQRRDHLFLAHFSVEAFVVHVQLDETRAHLDHHWYVLFRV